MKSLISNKMHDVIFLSGHIKKILRTKHAGAEQEKIVRRAKL
jgi:hypothetical protein